MGVCFRMLLNIVATSPCFFYELLVQILSIAFFVDSLEIFGNLWKSLEIFGNLWKFLEIFGYHAAPIWPPLGDPLLQAPLPTPPIEFAPRFAVI